MPLQRVAARIRRDLAPKLLCTATNATVGARHDKCPGPPDENEPVAAEQFDDPSEPAVLFPLRTGRTRHSEPARTRRWPPHREAATFAWVLRQVEAVEVHHLGP